MTTGGDTTKVFEKPEVTDLGLIVDLTSKMSDGDETDATVPQGPPPGGLTFS
jgi:hypothetical protein